MVLRNQVQWLERRSRRLYTGLLEAVQSSSSLFTLYARHFVHMSHVSSSTWKLYSYVYFLRVSTVFLIFILLFLKDDSRYKAK